MTRSKISISIPDDLLARIDAIAEARGDSRSYVIAKVLEQGIEAQEQFIKDMESPAVRGFARLMATSPNLMKALNAMGRDKMTADELEKFVERAPEQIERGKGRARTKRSGGES